VVTPKLKPHRSSGFSEPVPFLRSAFSVLRPTCSLLLAAIVERTAFSGRERWETVANEQGWSRIAFCKQNAVRQAEQAHACHSERPAATYQKRSSALVSGAQTAKLAAHIPPTSSYAPQAWRAHDSQPAPVSRGIGWVEYHLPVPLPAAAAARHHHCPPPTSLMR